MDTILEKMKQHKKQNLPFVLYRKPNSKTIVGIFQENDHVYFSNHFQEKGFVFAPFQGDNIVVFPLNFCKVNFDTFKPKNLELKDYQYKNFDNNNQELFENLVKKGISNINKEVFNKVVLSRTETIPFEELKIRKTFKKLLYQYPETYCYCWFHPKIGLWMGATPEKLLAAKGNQFVTMSLAGTQEFVNDDATVVWHDKEITEQEIVTRFIINNLENITTELNVSSPYTSKAGSLLHLKTDIEGILKSSNYLEQVINILHPTPAVCGFPKNEAKEFILKNEGFDREYYTGFLGELNYDFTNHEESTDLYVNLRCMKVMPYSAQLFMGCGITKDSVPNTEWEETVNKSKTMKRILKQIINR